MTSRADGMAERHRSFAATRDEVLRAELVEAYAGLARALAARYVRGTRSLEDLQQVAMVGLLKAVDGFDPDRGVQFVTYAWATITGELKRHVRDRSWGVHVPRRLQERFIEVNRAVDALTQDLGRSPTVPEIARLVGLSDEEVLETVEVAHGYRVGSLDEPRAGGDGPVRDQLGCDDPAFARADMVAVLSPLLARLPPREQRIVHLRFVEELSQSEIAAAVGISQMHVSRLLARSLAQLRAWADSDSGLVAGV